jgi:Alg9-like mannosyltransferase family
MGDTCTNTRASYIPTRRSAESTTDLGRWQHPRPHNLLDIKPNADPFIGKIYGFPNLLTWEFTTEQPVRSVFPLWPTYGLPMVVLRWLWTGTSTLSVPPRVVYYTLRLLMFMLSFVLEDWAIHELVESPRQRRMAVMLVASSYVTWTYQTHTFSNAVETILVLWSLVLVQRIRESKVRVRRLWAEPGLTLAAIHFDFGVKSSRHTGGRRHVQPHHLPSFSTWTAGIAGSTCPEKVSCWPGLWMQANGADQ